MKTCSMREIKRFLSSLYYNSSRSNRIPMEITARMRQRVRRYIKFIKRVYNRNWHGLKLINVKRERKLNRLEEQLINLF